MRKKESKEIVLGEGWTKYLVNSSDLIFMPRKLCLICKKEIDARENLCDKCKIERRWK